MFINDVRYAARLMTRTPVFAIAVILTIALAIGANTAVFSVVNAVMIRPLPFADPGHLVQVAEKNEKLNLPSFGVSALNFVGWREQQHSFEELGAFGSNTYTISSGTGDPEQLLGARISPSLTRVLGINPIAGRTFVDNEEKPGGASVAIIGEGLWKRRFGSDRSVIGRTVTIDSQPTTVVGVIPDSLNVLTGGDIYTPLVIDPPKEIRLNHVLLVFGRLKPGVSLQQARAEMDTVSARMDQQFPELKDWGITLITMFDTFVTPQLKTALIVLLCAVGCVLLIACANIANLLLARAAARQKEMAVRSALGASRWTLIWQLLTESVVLAVTGGALGILLALSAVRAIDHFLPPNLLPVPHVGVDRTVLTFAVALTVVSGLLFGIMPAWRTSRIDVNEGLKIGGRDATGTMRARMRNSLAAVEIGLATVLLIGAGLLIQSLANLQKVALGFESRGLITFQLAPPTAKYPVTDRAPIFYRSLLESLRSIPGVRGAATSSGVPLGNGNYTASPVATNDPSILPQGSSVTIDWRIASPGYFNTMRIPLLRGRDFTFADTAKNPVIIVSRATAKKFFGDADPLGRSLYRVADPKKSPFTIVGVVGDVHNTALNQDSPTLYYPVGFRVAGVMDVAVRTDGKPEALLPAIRQKVHELDADLALANIRTMDDWVSNSSAQPRLNAILLGSFAVMALLIAAIGIYGVLAYSVTQRTREIGVRMALGAQPGDVLRLVVREGMRVAIVGTCAGLVGGFVLGRAVSSLLYGVAVRDPATFTYVAALLMSVALAACAIPARRAARVDPMVALRYE
jgi:putative ABC transport system permease protein